MLALMTPLRILPCPIVAQQSGASLPHRAPAAVASHPTSRSLHSQPLLWYWITLPLPLPLSRSSYYNGLPLTGTTKARARVTLAGSIISTIALFALIMAVSGTSLHCSPQAPAFVRPARCSFARCTAQLMCVGTDHGGERRAEVAPALLARDVCFVRPALFTQRAQHQPAARPRRVGGSR